MIRPALVFVGLSLVLGCSSGLGNHQRAGTADASIPSTNLRFGFNPGMVLTDPFTAIDIAGGTLPAVGGGTPRPVAFLALVTAARSDDGDGAGNPLDRSVTPPADVAGTSDVFVAAVAADQIDTRAFVYSLASKMRHPRCTTCHSMNAATTTAFATAAHPGANLPVGTAANCNDCHTVADWRAPGAALDLRGVPASQLASRSAQAVNGPTGPELHFEQDPRVLWALGADGGQLPFGNVADDDHDGIAEAEDVDGRPRMVPGGVDRFLAQLDAWKQSGMKFDSREAVQDVVLASRAAGAARAGNGDSFAPSIHYRGNPSYVDGVSDPNAVPVGFVRVAFASDATDLVGGTTNGTTDVFLTDVSVFHRTDGRIDLAVVPGSQVLVSRGVSGDAQGGSTDPDLGGVDGARVAFTSTAPDLVPGFTDNNGAEPDVYVAEPAMSQLQLVSHAAGDAAAGGNGRSAAARLDPTGSVVVFESAASDLVAADTNGGRDVFYAALPALDVQRASVATGGVEAAGGDSFDPSVHVSPGAGDVRVAFTSTKTDLVAEPLPATQNVYLFDSRAGGSTLLLNRIAGPPGATARAPAGGWRDAGHARISPDGLTVLFESVAGDLDFVRSGDDNRVMDVMLADLRLLESDGFVLPYTLSVSAAGGEANGASHTPRIGALSPGDDAFPLGVAVFCTKSTNLSDPDVTGDADNDGVPDADNLVVMFLREGSTVVADFEATPERQGAGLEVQFESTSSGRPTSFRWDFGDGNSSTEAAPRHAYATPGSYTVTLDVAGELGRDDRQRPAYVRVLGPSDAMFATTKDAALSVPQAPAANVPNGTTVRGAIDPAGGTSLRFRFDASASTELPDSYTWSLAQIDAGTGRPLGAPVPFGTNAVAAETTLDARGTYEVSLESTGLGGAGMDARQRIEVWDRVAASFNATSAISGDAPLAVSFEDTTVGDLDTLSWRRNGTEFSTLATPSETFAEGVHQVELVATGRGGDQDTSSPVTITSFGALTAAFSPPSLEQIRTTTQSVTFTNQSMGTMGVPLSYFWDFGNGNTSTAASPPAQSYPVSSENVSEYPVRLVASTQPVAPTNCTGQGPTQCSEVTGTIRYFPPISASVSVSASSTQPRQITLTPSVTGDGTGTNPIYTFLRSTAGGTVPNITLGTFFDASARTFTVSGLGVYRFALLVQTSAPSGGSQSDTSASVVQEVFADFTTDVFSIIEANCVSCHSTAANCGTNGLLSYGSASPSALTVYNRIVDQNAAFCTGTCTGQPTRLIDSTDTDPNQSWFYKKLSNQAGSCGGVMPPATSGLGASDRAIFRSWIRGGAVF